MTEVTSKQLRKHLQLSTGGLAKILDAGIVERLGRNRWDLEETTRRYVEHLRAVAARHASPNSNLSLVEERAKLAAAQRFRVELENREKTGELVAVAEVEAAYFDLVRTIREQLLVIPDRVAAEVAAEEDLGACEKILVREIRAALERLTEEAPNLGRNDP